MIHLSFPNRGTVSNDRLSGEEFENWNAKKVENKKEVDKNSLFKFFLMENRSQKKISKPDDLT